MNKALKKFDFLVFIGRFQPFHNGHLRVVLEGLERSKHVIVLTGSAYLPRSLRNPWSFTERRDMLLASIPPECRERVIVAPLMDCLYSDNTWIKSVLTTVEGLVKAYHQQPQIDVKIGLLGHSKDNSSYYLSLFPGWDSISVDNVAGLNSTDIRNNYFAATKGQAAIKRVLPEPVMDNLVRFRETGAYRELVDECDFIQRYRSGWKGAPYAPTFNTVDAVVTQSGHVLLVERAARPGKGLWALPGGFIGQHETLLQACLRELKEETRIDRPLPVLEGSIKHQKVFDDPYRSARGRTITHAFHIDLKPEKKLAKVKGSSDAAKAFWLPLSKLEPQRVFEDHFFIIRDLLGF